jgi:hypothetical protein
MGSQGISVLVETGAWPEDAERFLASLERHRGDRVVEVLPVEQGDDGFGTAQNRALAEATGDVVVLVDPSLELTGDLLGPLVAALGDPTVAVAGPYGLTTADLCDYEEQTSGDVAAASRKPSAGTATPTSTRHCGCARWTGRPGGRSPSGPSTAPATCTGPGRPPRRRSAASSAATTWGSSTRSSSAGRT